MHPEKRRRHILGLLHQRERTSTNELARTLSTSQEAIHRDLAALAEQSLVSKLHEGAALPPSGEHENVFQTQVNERAQEKCTVARYTTDLSGPGDSVFIDTSTATPLFARGLARQSHLAMTTNSLLIAGSVGASGSRAFMIDGKYRPESERNVGVLTIEQITRFSAEHAVITIGMLNGDGAMGFSIEEAEIAHAVIVQARQLTVIADSSKLGRCALFQVFPLSRINRLVVNRKPTGELQEVLQQARMEVREAPLHTPQT